MKFFNKSKPKKYYIIGRIDKTNNEISFLIKNHFDEYMFATTLPYQAISFEKESTAKKWLYDNFDSFRHLINDDCYKLVIISDDDASNINP